MINKNNTPPRPIFTAKSAAERMLESSLSPTVSQLEEGNSQERKKKELQRSTGYYRPAQVRFMREYCESLRKKFNNENIKPPLLQRILLEIWDENTARRVEEYLRQQGYDKHGA